MKTNYLTRAHIIALVIVLLCFLALFITNKWEAGFSAALKSNPFKYDFTIRKLLLFIINFSLFVSIYKPLKNEDERIEKIKSYVRSNIFFLVITTVTLIGLLFNDNTILLISVAIFQLYYITVFWICVYKDPKIIYLSEKQLTAEYIATNKKYKLNYLQGMLIAVVIMVLGINHRQDLTALGLIISTYLLFMIRSIYIHWNS